MDAIVANCVKNAFPFEKLKKSNYNNMPNYSLIHLLPDRLKKHLVWELENNEMPKKQTYTDTYKILKSKC